MEIKAKLVCDLVPYANNAKMHGESQIEKIASSIKEFGFNNPILLDGDNGVIAGHGRLMAAKKLGLEEVPTIELSHLSEAQKKAYILADNRLGEIDVTWDMELVNIELEHLEEMNFDIDLTGFEIEKIPEEGLTDEDECPEPPETPVSVLGDIWQLGNHRLMCGDSTSFDSVDLLLEGEKVDMVWTDPPYNVDFKGALSNTSKNGKTIKMSDGYVNPSSTHRDIANDRMSKEDFSVFIKDILTVIKEYCVGGWYVCFASSTLNELLIPLVEADMKWKSLIIWNKNQSPMGGGHFRRKYEPIAYGYFNNLFYGKEYSEDDVWDVARTVKNDLHPTMKPVELVKKAIGFSSNSGGTCLDLFGGSGSAVIACEELNRKARLMELDEQYVDVIINRWQNFTGKQAIHIESGKTYAELKNG